MTFQSESPGSRFWHILLLILRKRGYVGGCTDCTIKAINLIAHYCLDFLFIVTTFKSSLITFLCIYYWINDVLIASTAWNMISLILKLQHCDLFWQIRPFEARHFCMITNTSVWENWKVSHDLLCSMVTDEIVFHQQDSKSISKFECPMNCCCQALIPKLETLDTITFTWLTYKNAFQTTNYSWNSSLALFR